MAEIIAIAVCGIIVLAFCLVCYIMVRNANKRKKMASIEKDKEQMQFDRINAKNRASKGQG